MKKRALLTDIPLEPTPEEKEFVPGALVSYYLDGTHYGHLLECDVDDDGDLFCKVQPIGSKNTAPKRKLGFKSSQLRIEK